ncbi:MAG: DUF1499 domain-containing protein [Oceanospirillaceae bacterium]
MNKFLIIALIVVFAIILFFIVLGQKSQQGAPLGLQNNKLQTCPDTPNCVSSEENVDPEHFITPMSLVKQTPEQIMEKVNKAVLALNGVVKTRESHYLAATFTSSLFRYVDDFEVRFDQEQQLVHFRSASRVGKSDFGANRKRVEAMKKLLQE